MNEESALRRREVNLESAFVSLQRLYVNLSLSEILTVFTSNSQQGMLTALYDPVSISIRAMALCELSLRGAIYLDAHKNVICSDNYPGIDTLHNEVFKAIKSSSRLRTIDKWLKLLNGESFSIGKDKYHIKHARYKVMKQLVEKNIFKNTTGMKAHLLKMFKQRAQSREETTFKKTKEEIKTEIKSYLLGTAHYHPEDILRLNALICSLSYCCILEDLYVSYSPNESTEAQRKATEIISKIKTSMGDRSNTKEWSVLCVLKEYLKLGSWM
ncbi:golgi phosphoprotein 3 [Nematocida sp. AWRm80]|nr:golgi phosphoprotein 3 [Nematocida sp. AWRm80]